MSKAIKAALFSALILPGIGHVYLKKHVRGYTLIAISLFSLYLFVSNFMSICMKLFDKILQGKVTNPNYEYILKLLENAESKSHITWITAASWVMCGLWVFSTIDSYRIGKKIKPEPLEKIVETETLPETKTDQN